MKKNVLLIIPAYNEEASLGTFIDSLYTENVHKYADILVIDDHSFDKTAQIALKKGVQVISHPYNLGYGMALQTGYKYAVSKGYDYVIQIDADGQHDARNVQRIYDTLHSSEKEDAPDIVIGSRFLDGSESFPVSFAKKAAISFFRRFICLTTKQRITDPTSGLQGLRRNAFAYYARYENFDTNYPDANMIIQMSLVGYRIHEIPAIMHRRTSGKSMHFGVIEPILYMLIMLFSALNVYTRKKTHILSQKIPYEGDITYEKK